MTSTYLVHIAPRQSIEAKAKPEKSTAPRLARPTAALLLRGWRRYYLGHGDRRARIMEGVPMAFRIRRVEYFTTTVQDRPGEAYKLLSQLAGLGLNLVAFTAVPIGSLRSQLTLFPDDPLTMAEAARKAALILDGPHPALLVQGDDELGALARIHEKLFEADVNVYASSGVANGRGSFGYVIYVRPEEYARAAAALGV